MPWALERTTVKQRFLNQKLGKRGSHRAEERRAKAAVERIRQRPHRTPATPQGRAGK